jgi:hypothetical protein
MCKIAYIVPDRPLPEVDSALSRLAPRAGMGVLPSLSTIPARYQRERGISVITFAKAGHSVVLLLNSINARCAPTNRDWPLALVEHPLVGCTSICRTWTRLSLLSGGLLPLALSCTVCLWHKK